MQWKHKKPVSPMGACRKQSSALTRLGGRFCIMDGAFLQSEPIDLKSPNVKFVWRFETHTRSDAATWNSDPPNDTARAGAATAAAAKKAAMPELLGKGRVCAMLLKHLYFHCTTAGPADPFWPSALGPRPY